MMAERDKKLAEENLALVYAYCRDHNLPLDPWASILSLRMCEVLPSYDESKGKLSTYLYLAFMHKVEMVHRKENAKRRIPKELMYSLADKTSATTELTLQDQLPDNTIGRVENTILISEILKWCRDNLTQEEYNIYILYLEGYTQFDIVEKLGISSQGKVSVVLKSIFDRIRKEFVDA